MLKSPASVLVGLLSQKLTRDISWSLGSFFILAISGVVINVAVTAIRDVAALGIFNLAYAVYIVASQFAVWGIHYSVLRHAAYYQEDIDERSKMLCTAALVALVLGAFSAAVLVPGAALLAVLYDSEPTGAAIRYAAAGLILFPLNKVLLAYLNGLREMKAFSLLQGLRYLTVMASVTAIVASSLPTETSTLAFLIAESATAVLAVGAIHRKGLVKWAGISAPWIKRHLAFGSKGLFGGMFAEINSRVDVLLIGFFLNESATGIYSFAAMLVDGLYHILAMVRINFNPILVAAVRDDNWEEARRLRAQARRFVLPAVIGMSVLLVLAYVSFGLWIMPDKGILDGFLSLIILLVGLGLVSTFVPFDNLMVVSGHPGYQAIQQIATVASNVVIAASLLPLLGIEGAAIGTATSYVVGVLVLTRLSRRLLGWRLITNEIVMPISR